MVNKVRPYEPNKVAYYDEINDFRGAFAVCMATTLDGKKRIKQKIPFGGTEYFELLLKRA